MLCMPIVCVLSTLIYITFLLHMFTQHMDTLIYMNISVAYVYSAYGHIDLHEHFCFVCLLSILSTIVYITCLHFVMTFGLFNMGQYIH
ncbi:hypothetical protein HanRHA438_Chr02g0065641 [Helianthus annuus]|nr:hypothetical protein HanRHA438_Chr02g0065641 [Helianthus annuus]